MDDEMEEAEELLMLRESTVAKTEFRKLSLSEFWLQSKFEFEIEIHVFDQIEAGVQGTCTKTVRGPRAESSWEPLS